MAFKMKAGKEGPMRKNFPAAFKQDLKKIGKDAAQEQSDEIFNVKTEDTKRRNDLLVEGIKKRMQALQDEIKKKKKMGVDFSQQMKLLSELEDKLQNVKKPN